MGTQVFGRVSFSARLPVMGKEHNLRANLAMHPLETYLADIGTLRGATKETSGYPALANLLKETLNKANFANFTGVDEANGFGDGHWPPKTGFAQDFRPHFTASTAL